MIQQFPMLINRIFVHSCLRKYQELLQACPFLKRGWMDSDHGGRKHLMIQQLNHLDLINVKSEEFVKTFKRIILILLKVFTNSSLRCHWHLPRLSNQELCWNFYGQLQQLGTKGPKFHRVTGEVRKLDFPFSFAGKTFQPSLYVYTICVCAAMGILPNIGFGRLRALAGCDSWSQIYWQMETT